MRKVLIILAITILTLLLLAGVLLAQKKPAFLGVWTGYTIIGDGSHVDITVSFEQGEAGYTGSLEAAGMIPASPLRDIVFNDGKLTLEFDLFNDAGGSQLIKIELVLDQETLKGRWIDAQGNSDIVELTLKK